MNPMQGSMLGQGDVLQMQAQLFRKLMNVVTKMENIKKSGYNAHQKYHYSTEQDLIDSVRQLLIDNKILILSDSETKEVIKITKPDAKGNPKESLVTVVNTRHTFCDIDTGYTYNIQSTGTGWDETDKGSFKAITGAMKYFLSKNFLVPGEDDAENDGVTPKVSAAPTSIAPKSFNRPTVQVAATPETKVAETPKAAVAQTTEINVPKVEATISKPRFGQRTTVTNKSEPSFP
jgi:hypothetical protein